MIDINKYDLEKMKKETEETEKKLPKIDRTLEELWKLIFFDEKNKDLKHYSMLLLAMFLQNDKLVFTEDYTKKMVEMKRERKFYFINVILDIIYTCGYIAYKHIDEHCIIAVIIDKEFLDALTELRKVLIKEAQEDQGKVEEILKKTDTTELEELYARSKSSN